MNKQKFTFYTSVDKLVDFRFDPFFPEWTGTAFFDQHYILNLIIIISLLIIVQLLRKKIFLANLNKINLHNQRFTSGKETYQVAVNKLSDQVKLWRLQFHK